MGLLLVLYLGYLVFRWLHPRSMQFPVPGATVFVVFNFRSDGTAHDAVSALEHAMPIARQHDATQAKEAA